MDRAHGDIRADVVHDKLIVMGFAGAHHPPCVSDAKRAYAAGRRGVYRP